MIPTQGFAKRLEAWLENFLWGSRAIVLVAVLASLMTAFAVFYLATVDTWLLVREIYHYADTSLSEVARKEIRSQAITHVVEVIDGYLLATVLLIFALGLYELFISALDQARRSESFAKVLIINNLDDLKSRLGKVILIILIVRFFEQGLKMEFARPLDLLAFAGGIALVGLALFLSHSAIYHLGASEETGGN
ncbi:MAG: YqhA family protein [Methylohalobius sp.]